MKYAKLFSMLPLFFSTVVLTTCSLAAEEKKPNIVLLYIDDWAWNGSSVAMHPDMPNSRMPVVQMPNLNRMAREGMVFQNAYGSPQCSPARACSKRILYSDTEAVALELRAVLDRRGELPLH